MQNSPLALVLLGQVFVLAALTYVVYFLTKLAKEFHAEGMERLRVHNREEATPATIPHQMPRRDAA